VPIAHPRKKPASTLAEPRPPGNARERQQLFGDAFAPVRLSGRALGAMRRGGIASLDDLLGWTESELVTIRAVGKSIAREIARAVEETGLTLRRDGESDTKTEKV
jgi:DNA-directed RNA polymerase alpha subunit